MVRLLYKRLRMHSQNYFDAKVNESLEVLPTSGLVKLLDVGAAGEVEPRWRPFKKRIKYVGFEPDKRTRDKLLTADVNFADYKIYPICLSDKPKSVPIYLCQNPEVSSLYMPNMTFLQNFPGSERFKVVREENIEAASIDSLPELSPDFVKLDIQGSERDVLKGAASVLNDVLGLEVEVEFVELYKGQSLFGDVCEELAKFDLEFFDFVNIARWERFSYNTFGQSVFGDALFLRKPEKLNYEQLSLEKLCSYLVILVIYRRFDLIEKTLTGFKPSVRSEFKKFEEEVAVLKRRNKRVRRLVVLFDKFISLFGNNLRLHLIQ